MIDLGGPDFLCVDAGLVVLGSIKANHSKQFRKEHPSMVSASTPSSCFLSCLDSLPGLSVIWKSKQNEPLPRCFWPECFTTSIVTLTETIHISLDYIFVSSYNCDALESVVKKSSS